jgi:peptide/nickel transport system permease protein
MKRLGLLTLGALLLWAFCMPLAGIDGREQALMQSLAPPSAAHLAQWLGLDLYGRSVLARLADATRHSLVLAAFSVGLAAAVGALCAAISALAVQAGARRVDAGVMALADACAAIPGLLWVLLGSLALSSIASAGDFALYLGLALALWVEFYRVLRALSLRVMRSQSVEAAQLLGLSRARILQVHLWPAVAQPLGRLAALNLAQTVLAVAALGFIGVGLKPPRADLGLMMTEYLPHYAEAPWLMAAPIVVLMIFVLGAMALADGRKEEAAL